MKLNQQQQSAIEYIDGPLLVLAGAGSGKTRVITEKIAHLIRRGGLLPREIAAITFTNKAAAEMRERAGKLLSAKEARGLQISTFHALGMRIVREEADALGLKKHFSVFDASDAGRIIAEMAGSSGREAVFRMQQRISLWKNALLTPDAAFQAASNAWERQAAQIYAGYEQTLRAYQAVDFDDLIVLPCRLFAENSAVKYRWQIRLRYLLIDECQDTNACQYMLMRHLVGTEARFTAVGDDDQSIYAWRGADVENLRRLAQDYPRLKVIKLEQNYRSTQRILRVANAVIAHNPKTFAKNLWSEYAEGEPVQVWTCRDERHEAEEVAGKIGMEQRIGRAKYADFAVLYRGNHQAKLFEEALRAARIPYRISGGQSFFDKTEIKDILAYIRLLANPDDDPAFVRAVTVPKRGIGEVALEKLHQAAGKNGESLYAAACRATEIDDLSSAAQKTLQQWAGWLKECRELAQTESSGSMIQKILQDIQYDAYLEQSEESKSGENRRRNVQDLAAWLARKGREDGKNLLDLAQTLALISLLENKNDEEADAVRLSTLHAAKGLEYPHVFLVGCEEGVFPHADSIENGNLAEERRLMYVGITRARETLVITHAVKRRRAGHWHFRDASRFIAEMPAADVQKSGAKDNSPAVDKDTALAYLAAVRAALPKKDGGF